MNRRHHIVLNTGFSALQVLVNAGVMLVLYRFLYDQLGASLAGVWALVLSWSALTSVASLGLAGGTARFVARHRARGDDLAARTAIDTTIVTVGAVLGMLVPVVYAVLYRALPLVYLPGEEPALLRAAQQVLPYALGTFWVNTVGFAVLSAIDGLERVSIRNGLVMGASVVYLLLALWLVPSRRLIGLAEAQLIQATILLLGGWWMLRRLFPAFGWIPTRWKYASLKEMLGYGLGAQAISITQMLFEPVTKTLIASLNPATVFFFDMALKLTVQARSVVGTAHSALIPTLAVLSEQAPERLHQVYHHSCRLMLLVVAIALPMAIGLMPYISLTWLGQYEPSFVLYGVMLAFAWFVSLLGNPAYYDNWGTGKLGWNVAGHAITAGINVSLGWLLGRVVGPAGVVFAFSIALVIGNGTTMMVYQRTRSIATLSWVEGASLRLLLVGLGLAGIAWFVWHQTRAAPWWLFLAVVAWGGVLLWPLTRHPLVRTGWQWVRRQRGAYLAS